MDLKVDAEEVEFLHLAIGSFIEGTEQANKEGNGLDEQELKKFNMVRNLYSKIRKLHEIEYPY